MLFTLAFLLMSNRSETAPITKPLSEFPKSIGQWTGRESFFDDEIYDELGVDDSALISYIEPGGKTVDLYVGYHNSQREGDLMHSPKHCLPGAGWDITKTTIEEIAVMGDKGKKIKSIKLIVEKGNSSIVVLYWFQSRGRFISSEYMQKIYLVLDAFTRNRTDGAFVRLMAPVGPMGEAYTTDYLKTFAGDLIPILGEHLPD
jgi:EpsI family protein